MASAAAELLQRRWRTVVAAAAGVATGFGVHALGGLPGVSTLIGWDAAAAVYLALTGPTLLFDTEADLRHRARREDENRAVLMSLILGCVAFSFAAIIIALREAKDPHVHESHALLVALSVATLVLSWLVVQSLFTLHYAHRYFGDRDDDGEVDGGIEFQGEKPSTYRDFIYVAVCIGCCFQVSDFALTGRRFRNLVTAHALISFAFNTLVLALGINIVSNLLGD
jgi:uncharacterized membrane protein